MRPRFKTGAFSCGINYSAVCLLPLIFFGRLFYSLVESIVMILNEHNSMPYMKSMAICLSRMLDEGYTEDFKVTDAGLQAIKHERVFRPEEVNIVNFFRFEGESDPDDNAILYVIETNDGTRGTLIDAYGVYSDPKITRFLKEVDSIQKNTTKK